MGIVGFVMRCSDSCSCVRRFAAMFETLVASANTETNAYNGATGKMFNGVPVK